DEVRIAVRTVLDAARSGLPFDRMALLWPADRPYARIVEHHLGAAGLPWNGRPGTTTAERAVPRVLAELLQLDRRGLRRSNLTTLLGDVPAQRRGQIVRAARWERIGRDAGVLREQHWDTNLRRWIDRARERRPYDVADAEDLHAFVTELRAALGSPSDTRTWSGWAQWSKEQLDTWFGHRLDRLDGHERSAWEDTQRVLDRLGHLDTFSAPVDRAEFRATFVAELDVAPARHGTVGDGIHVGTLAGVRGLDVDLVVVLGAADGLLPPPPAVDPLLGDHERQLAGLVTSEERVRIAHRQFLALTTTTPRVVVIVPRGDLRATAAHHPSRWLAPLLVQAGCQLRHIDSHAHGVISTEFPVSVAEHRIRDLWAHVSTGAGLQEHARLAGDPVLSAALRMRTARAADRLTVFDGDLSSRPIPAFDTAISPTQLEAWRACPHAYFVRYLLGVRPIEEPDEITVLTPLDRGSAIHDAIDRLQQRVLSGELADPGTEGWAGVHDAALRAIADEVADGLVAAGRSGRIAYWVTERTKILGELGEWLAQDTEHWAGRRLLASERRFGDDGPAVDVALPSGRRIAFKGSIDRVDELADGTLLVTDHKTGKVDRFTKFASDPTLGGSRFQLPVYAAAARVLLERPDAPVAAEYAFFATAGFRRLRATLDDDVWERFVTALDDVVAGIESGVFPLVPEPPRYRHHIACEYCEPDGLGTAPQWAQWSAKRNDPRLARWFAQPAEVHQ
ncbi:MAG: PD-(D/E)XK nuclease family protein, partial [Actinomycetota bacterium]|nr:PD-(D/E)XK nuclease family protein [Actinomycetota bacterium]